MKRLILLLILAAVLLSGCDLGDKNEEPFKDAPRSGLNSDPAVIVEMPDGFSNVATKCVGDVRITVAYHGNSTYGAISSVIDPACEDNK